jgi:hypothetical protein
VRGQESAVAIDVLTGIAERETRESLPGTGRGDREAVGGAGSNIIPTLEEDL